VLQLFAATVMPSPSSVQASAPRVVHASSNVIQRLDLTEEQPSDLTGDEPNGMDVNQEAMSAGDYEGQGSISPQEPDEEQAPVQDTAAIASTVIDHSKLKAESVSTSADQAQFAQPVGHMDEHSIGVHMPMAFLQRSITDGVLERAVSPTATTSPTVDRVTEPSSASVLKHEPAPVPVSTSAPRRPGSFYTANAAPSVASSPASSHAAPAPSVAAAPASSSSHVATVTNTAASSRRPMHINVPAPQDSPPRAALSTPSRTNGHPIKSALRNSSSRTPSLDTSTPTVASSAVSTPLAVPNTPIPEPAAAEADDADSTNGPPMSPEFAPTSPPAPEDKVRVTRVLTGRFDVASRVVNPAIHTPTLQEAVVIWSGTIGLSRLKGSFQARALSLYTAKYNKPIVHPSESELSFTLDGRCRCTAAVAAPATPSPANSRSLLVHRNDRSTESE